MLIITYVDDCIIVGNSMLDINTFVESMKNGSEGFILTDEGDINKFLGIEIKQITKNKFELSQPYLTERIVNLLGLKKKTTYSALTVKLKSLQLGNLYSTRTLPGNHANYRGNTEQQLGC